MKEGAAPPLTRVLAIAGAAALVPLNSTMIAVALPVIGDDFGVSTGSLSILVTVYLVVMLVGQPLAGRAVDVIGSFRAINVGLIALAAISAGAALAPSLALLIVARALQGVCAAFLGPATQALLASISPPADRGRIFGIHGSMIGVGAASGPVVGGVLVQLSGWEAIFLFNVPIALVSWLAIRPLRHAVPLSSNELRRRPVGGAVPSFDRIANRVFVAGYATQVFAVAANYGMIILTPLILDARGWGAGSIGLALSSLTVGVIVAGPAGGRLGDRYGPRAPSCVGMLVAAVPMLALAIVGGDAPAGLIIIVLALFGLGFGATTPNLLSSALGSVPGDRTGSAAGIFATSRYVGSISSTVLIGVLVTSDASGATTALVVSAACLVAALGVATQLPSIDRTIAPARIAG